MKTMVLNYPLLYCSSNGDYELIESTLEFADVFRYFDTVANCHAIVKQLERVAGGANMRLCLFKESGLLCPQSNLIDAKD